MNRLVGAATATVLAALCLTACEPSTETPACGVWFGAATNPTDGESWESAQARFEQIAGRPVDITHYYKRGQEELFPTAGELSRQDESGSQRTLFYNWRPQGLTWRQVTDGAADAYLASLGAHMAVQADKPFFLSLHAEMEDEVNQDENSGRTAADFADFYRHTVSTLRSNGAVNAVMVMNYTGARKWTRMPWFKELYPGTDFVDWIAQDPYAYNLEATPDLASLVNQRSGSSWPGFYNWAAAKYPEKPQMLAEWGVHDPASDPEAKPRFFRSALEDLASLPKLRALVYWDHPGTGPDGKRIPVGRTAVDSSPAALAAFQSFISSPAMNPPPHCALEASIPGEDRRK